MRGSIKLGRWWIPFRARQILAPLHGFVWAARVAGVLVGSDRYAGGAGRWSGSSSWVPAAVLPRFGVTWTATDTQHATASYRLDDTELELRYTFDDDARVKSIALDRWGDPENSGTWGVHRFMREMNRYSTFGSVTIPSAGRAAWLIGTDRWSEGDFFRYEITDYHLVTPATSKRGHESSEGVTRADLSSPRCRDLVPPSA